MSNRIFDASELTKRKAEKAIAGSFINRLYPPINTNGNQIRQPQQGFGLVPGIYDSSIMNAVKSGHMTQFTRYSTCYNISPGCPCPEVNSNIIQTSINPATPGPVSGITFTIGSIIVSWNPPDNGDGPFTYIVTPYLNGNSLSPITTSNTSYRFTDLEEWQPYTFTVCAMNSNGNGPIIPSSSYFIAPPTSLSNIISGSSTELLIEPSLKYIINAGLDVMLNYISKSNLGPTVGSRFIYVWITSVVSAWNWVRSESVISGIHDNWNWDNKSSNFLSNNDSIIWLTIVIDYITPFFIPSGYKSIYNCSDEVISRVKLEGEWDNWKNNWLNWFNYRQNDGNVEARLLQPVNSENWNQTIVVDGTTINNISDFPAPNKWTRLTVQDKKQNYLTYNWISVLSTCLNSIQEENILNSVSPVTGLARDEEIDAVKNITANLTDEQKIIAEFWAGGPGTVSPPLMFIWLWKEYIRINDISCPNIMFSLLDLAVHLFEGSRIIWQLKTKFMEARPIQEIRRRYTGQTISSWNGTIDGSQWTPYQESNFISPPFADFPSGHSYFSKAFALTMNKWFGQDINKISTFYDGETLICPLFSKSTNSIYGDFSIIPGSSLIEPKIVPGSNITLSFDKWDDMAEQAGVSRFYGGIHAVTAHTGSQQVALELDTLINSTWNIQPL